MTLIYAHRGSSGTFPENTLLAFRQALASGADGIELDVHATSDDVPVVIHDSALARTTNGAGNVDALTLDLLQSLDAGSGERVPTLREVLILVEDSVHLDIEIKGAGIESLVLAVLAEFPRARWAISSFDWDTLRRLRRQDSGAVLWPLADYADAALFAIAKEVRAPAVSLYCGAYNTESAAALVDAGLAAVIWTVNDPDEARRVQGFGAYALCTDYPERIAAALGEVDRSSSFVGR